MDHNPPTNITAARRRFLATCGKYAVVTPPTVALMLSVTARKYGVAASGGHANNGFGNGGNDGVPGNSNHQDITR
jgi:hypothetical protein